MTLPNKLTLVRIFLIPVMIIIPYIAWFNKVVVFENLTLLYLLEFVIFAVASITDFFDGHIARSRNLVTTFGKFADPLADKMLVFSAMAILMVYAPVEKTALGAVMPMWAFVIMIIREFMVSGIRMLVASKGVVIPAGKLGKFKTFTTMIAICVLFFAGAHDIVAYSGQILMYVACLFTVISGAEYFWQSRKVIFESI